MAAPIPALADRARSCTDRLRESAEVLLVSHIDADGLTSAAIAATALRRAGIPHEVAFCRQLDARELDRIAAADPETVLFTDFGSGQIELIADHADAGDFTPVIVDHHQVGDADVEHHLNPLLEGLDGSTELSGAGAAYVLARDLGEDNRDLAALAVVGAVGDMQDAGGELVGANREIVAEGIEAGVIETSTDLSLYGKQTRPLPKLLEYGSEVRIPGVSSNPAGSRRFLEELDIELKAGDEWRTWADLTIDEKRRITSGIVRRGVEGGVAASEINDIVATAYELTAEPPGTQLRDASEYATLLNSTARYDRADVGLAVCLGDRDEAYRRAKILLRSHRQNLSQGLDWVVRNGVTAEEHIQWFDAGDAIRETIVGIVAGMALGESGIERGRPIVAFASKSDEPALKVSGRGTHRLTASGLDLSAVMTEAATAVGGEGGGHDVAAGATIPATARDRFIELADDIVGRQLEA
ncbi:MAG: DHH family phosphoesterase [Halobacteriota archaeon]